MTVCFNSNFYFPDKNGSFYFDKATENILIDWVNLFLFREFDKVVDTSILQTLEEKNKFIIFIVKKTKELFYKIIEKTDYRVHNDTVKNLFLVCFLISFKFYTATDYEILYNNNGDGVHHGMNMRTLSKAVPYVKEEETIKTLCRMESEVLRSVNWVPFKTFSFE